MSKVGNIEWLSNSLSMKCMSLEVISGGSKADIEWTDKCGVFATLAGEQLKALACLLAWGDWKDSDDNLNTVTTYLVHNAMNSCAKRGLSLRGARHSLPDLLQRMARMAVYLHLRPELQKVFPTIYGRLYFCGINMDEGTYRRTWREFEVAMMNTLAHWESCIDDAIGEYRDELKKVAV